MPGILYLGLTEKLQSSTNSRKAARHRPSGQALQPDAEVVLLWSSNFDAKILIEFNNFAPYLPCTFFALREAKALPSLMSCVFKEALLKAIAHKQ
jgi:hypothetical protein